MIAVGGRGAAGDARQSGKTKKSGEEGGGSGRALNRSKAAVRAQTRPKSEGLWNNLTATLTRNTSVKGLFIYHQT